MRKITHLNLKRIWNEQSYWMFNIRGGSLPYAIRGSDAQWGRDFGDSDLERGIHFRDVFWNGV